MNYSKLIKEVEERRLSREQELSESVEKRARDKALKHDEMKRFIKEVIPAHLEQLSKDLVSIDRQVIRNRSGLNSPCSITESLEVITDDANHFIKFDLSIIDQSTQIAWEDDKGDIRYIHPTSEGHLLKILNGFICQVVK